MRKLPISIEDFKELRENRYYYVDKSLFIADVLDEKVALYTRPRRFGKTLNMSMLYYFFSVKEKKAAYIFEGLAISAHENSKKYQNQYPVLSLSLKELKNNTFEKQLSMFRVLIQNFLRKNQELFESPALNPFDIELLKKYYIGTKDEVELQTALQFICHCLRIHYNQRVIVLIDEYDVPLQNAYLHGYYNEMTAFLGNVFSALLKTNEDLEKGILTGCLKIAKESIFTGLNNFNIYSIFNRKSCDSFGFRTDEVNDLLQNYHLLQCQKEIQEWYDGYRFGDQEIYNPWSVLKYINKAIQEGKPGPESFWANTSGNDIIYQYITQADRRMQQDFDILSSGGTIDKAIKDQLTYREMDDINNIYSFLLYTGYLKVTEKTDNSLYRLMIPNKEIKYIYLNIFDEWFQSIVSNTGNAFADALLHKDEENARMLLNDLLMRSISYYDNREDFYHGFLVGLLQNYTVKSNRESGNGRFDLCLIPDDFSRRGLIIECKKADSLKTLKKSSENAAEQIKMKGYMEEYLADGYTDFVGYGIAFYKKQCYITLLNDTGAHP